MILLRSNVVQNWFQMNISHWSDEGEVADRPSVAFWVHFLFFFFLFKKKGRKKERKETISNYSEIQKSSLCFSYIINKGLKVGPVQFDCYLFGGNNHSARR